MDVHDKKTRSYSMSQVKGKNTKPEELVRKYLFVQGFRYRKNDKRLPGSPDVVLPRYRTVIFVNGCFWHGHAGCRYFVWSQNNADFWEEKIQNNITRDKKNYDKLQEMGGHILVVWECDLKPKAWEFTLSRLSNSLKEATK